MEYLVNLFKNNINFNLIDYNTNNTSNTNNTNNTSNTNNINNSKNDSVNDSAFSSHLNKIYGNHQSYLPKILYKIQNQAKNQVLYLKEDSEIPNFNYQDWEPIYNWLTTILLNEIGFYEKEKKKLPKSLQNHFELLTEDAKHCLPLYFPCRKQFNLCSLIYQNQDIKEAIHMALEQGINYYPIFHFMLSQYQEDVENGRFLDSALKGKCLNASYWLISRRKLQTDENIQDVILNLQESLEKIKNFV